MKFTNKIDDKMNMIKDNSELSSNKIYIDKQKVLEEFFSVYLNGRKNKKVPKNYIDYFEARHFLTRLLNRKRYNHKKTIR